MNEIDFPEFGSVLDVRNSKTLEHMRRRVPDGARWVVQEKIHGANLRIMCDCDLNVTFGSRSETIETDEDFRHFNSLDLHREELENKAKALVMNLLSVGGLVEYVVIFAEIFGGSYPHPDVDKNPMAPRIQKGVFYTPDNEVMAYDLLCKPNDALDGKPYFIRVDTANEILARAGFMVPDTLYEGWIEECLEYPNDRCSQVFNRFGLPQLSDNTMEGLVIKPITPFYLENGKRVILKSKNAKYHERKQGSNRILKPDTPAVDAMTAYAEDFVNFNRLESAVSKIGSLEHDKNIGKVIVEMCNDVLVDMAATEDDTKLIETLESLTAFETKRLQKNVSKMCRELVLANR